MPRVDSVRTEIMRLIRAVPFQAFAINLENGDRLIIEHPENIAFDPTPSGRENFYVLSQKLQVYSSFSAVSSVALLDTAEIE